MKGLGVGGKFIDYDIIEYKGRKCLGRKSGFIRGRSIEIGLRYRERSYDIVWFDW